MLQRMTIAHEMRHRLFTRHIVFWISIAYLKLPIPWHNLCRISNGPKIMNSIKITYLMFRKEQSQINLKSNQGNRN